MERLVFFGKGGIGKSTTSSNVSATLAGLGHRVLHVGCDPKHDSTVSLLGGQLLEPVVDKIHSLDGITPEDIVVRSPLGIDCVEAGGPEAGVGCGGRGITRMMEIFKAAKLLAPGRYTTAVYDVLGDVVCGGFAAPLRKDIGEKVVIVASEEVMAFYAANNIAKAVVHYHPNGIQLAGIIINLRDNNEDRGPAERFARLLNTELLGFIPRDSLIREAEYRRMTVVEYAPASPIARVFRELTERILSIDASKLPLPTPLSETDFYEYTRRKFEKPGGGIGAAVPDKKPATAAPAVVPVSSLKGPRNGAAEQRANGENGAGDRAGEYRAEVRAGARAVRLGLLGVDEALRRLKHGYPLEAAGLQASDLWS